MERKSNWSYDELEFVFSKTNGMCRHCNKSLVFDNRTPGQRGAWHMDHGRALADGGSNNLRNIWALCVACNQDKSMDNGTDYDEPFVHESIKGRAIDLVNRYIVSDPYDNNVRRVRR